MSLPTKALNPKPVFENIAVSIYLNEEKQYVYCKFKHMLDIEELRRGHLEVAYIFERTGMNRYIADLTEAGTYPEENQKVLREEVFPAMEAAGLQCFSVILAKSVVASVSHNQLAEDFLQKRYTFIETDNFEEAERYLVEQD